MNKLTFRPGGYIFSRGEVEQLLEAAYDDTVRLIRAQLALDLALCSVEVCAARITDAAHDLPEEAMKVRVAMLTPELSKHATNYVNMALSLGATEEEKNTMLIAFGEIQKAAQAAIREINPDGGAALRQLTPDAFRSVYFDLARGRPAGTVLPENTWLAETSDVVRRMLLETNPNRGIWAKVAEYIIADIGRKEHRTAVEEAALSKLKNGPNPGNYLKGVHKTWKNRMKTPPR